MELTSLSLLPRRLYVDVIELFEQRLELVKEYPSWMEYICPLCGSKGLKINKVTSYYKNYKCTCDTKRITAFIYQDSGITYVPKAKQVPKVVESVPNLSNLKLSIVANPSLLNDLNNKYQDLDGIVLYQYSTNQRTKRINRLKSNGKKVVIPQTGRLLNEGVSIKFLIISLSIQLGIYLVVSILVFNYQWVNGIGEGIFPIFTNQRTLVSELIIVAEGEKCVEYLNYKGIEAMSLLGSYTTSITKIQEVIEVSRSKIPNVLQFLYLPDLDAKGMQKALIFQKAVWEMRLPCKIFDLRTKLLQPIGCGLDFKRGYDVADFITEFPDSNLVSVFEDEFRDTSRYQDK